MSDPLAPASDPLAALRAAAEGTAPPSPAPAHVTPIEAAVRADAEAPRFVGGKSRESAVALDYPVQHGGKLYASIVRKRPSAKAVGDYFEYLRERPEVASAYFPVFCHPDGEPVPEAVLDFLDAEDFDRVMESLSDFLPPRLRDLQVAMRAVSDPGAGDPTEPKS